MVNIRAKYPERVKRRCGQAKVIRLNTPRETTNEEIQQKDAPVQKGRKKIDKQDVIQKKSRFNFD